MQDYLIRAISTSGSVRAYAAITTSAVSEAYKNQAPASLSGVILGRVLTGVALLGGTVKNRERLAIKFEGNGPISKAVAESDGFGNIRGYVSNPEINFTEEHSIIKQLRSALGNAGLLTVTKDLGLKTPYTGAVHIVSGEIGEDIAYYLTDSEQIPSAVGVASIPSSDGEYSEVSGGFLIQAVPQEGGTRASDEANIESIQKMAEAAQGSLSQWLMEGMRPEDILTKLFAEVPFKVLDQVPLTFNCDCGKDRFLAGIKTLGGDQIESLMETPNISIECEFCKKVHTITKEELQNLL